MVSHGVPGWQVWVTRDWLPDKPGITRQAFDQGEGWVRSRSHHGHDGGWHITMV